MADSKISALPSATTPLAGTEVLPIVQSGVTDKITVNNLAAGNLKSQSTTGVLQVSGPTAGTTRVMTTPDANFTAARTDAANSFTGDQTLSTGNLIQGTAAKGFNFTANSAAAGKTSQLLNYYEEGTFTPVVKGSTSAGVGTYSVQNGYYTRIGNLVSFTINLTWSAHTGTGNMSVETLPFSVKNSTGAQAVFSIRTNNLALTASNYPQIYAPQNANYIVFEQMAVGGGSAAAVPIDTAAAITITGQYQV